MSNLEDRRDLVTAVWRTWGAKGLARRATYEVAKRRGRLLRREAGWQAEAVSALVPLRSAGITVPATVTDPGPDADGDLGRIVLYGGLALTTPIPPAWHRQPLEGHDHPAGVHWSTIRDDAAETGDIKDVWELSRLGWLHPRLRRAVARGDDAAVEGIWQVVEDWYRENPPYLGPNWMCAQETSLRTISVMFLADALDGAPATTDERRLLVADLVRDAVGRVAPTLGYALSQRNNHATSEAGFLWTASVLAPWLPDAAAIRRRAASALTEVVADQVGADGSYSQHSPTYHRVALHVLLWCLHVSRATGEPAPDGLVDAVGRSVVHLRSLLVPGSAGRVPNLGGNDGALVFDLAPTPIGDLRPLLAHAAAASGQPSGLEPGPWDEEASWFGLEPAPALAVRPVVVARARSTHALTRGSAHAVLRAGPLGHRPAHADQLHLDVWLGGEPVAVDAGSYRYTAPEPWGNALAGDDVHNVPRRPSAPQAVRSGRFFWRRWAEAEILERFETNRTTAIVARLGLVDGTVLHRAVGVTEDLVVVVDRSTTAAELRWNLPAGAAVEPGGDDRLTVASAGGWAAALSHGGPARLPVPVQDDPASGWCAPSYAVREPLVPVLVPLGPGSPVISAFAVVGRAAALPDVVAAARGLDPAAGGATRLAGILSTATAP